MSVASKISRIQTNRNSIRAKLVELGMAQSDDNLDKLAASVESIENRGAVSATVQEGDTYTIPKGYHNGSGSVSGVAGGGNYSLQSKAVTPTRLQQNVTPDSGCYGLSDVTVAAIPDNFVDTADANALAANILAGKTAYVGGVKITGTMANNGSATKTIDGLTTTSVTIPAGYTSSGTVSLTDDIEQALASI